MPTYKIMLTGRRYIVLIEADSLEEAEELAYEDAQSLGFWEIDDIEQVSE